MGASAGGGLSARHAAQLDEDIPWRAQVDVYRCSTTAMFFAPRDNDGKWTVL